MTLILTIANLRGVHQSSDYQLTDPRNGHLVSDRAGSKQLEAGFRRLHLNLAFTGVAEGTTGRTMDWLSAELKALPHDSTLQNICKSLAKRSTREMKPYRLGGVLTLVLTAAEVEKPFRVAEISNVRNWKEKPPRAKGHFDIQIRTVKRPFHLISGYRDCVPLLERQRLKALARDPNRTTEEIGDALAAINAIAAKKSGGSVSNGCWISSQVVDGKARRFDIRNVGQHGDSVQHILGGVDVADLMKKQFEPAPGEELRVKHIGGLTMGRSEPPLPPEGDPKDFTFSGSSIAHALWSSGQRCAKIEIVQLDCIVSARRNEKVRVPFAQIQFSNIQKCADLPPPKLPWPLIGVPFAINGVPIARGWEFAIGYWIERGLHHFVIPRSFRNIQRLAFLEDDDLLIVRLISGCEFACDPSEVGPTGTLEAEILWRSQSEREREAGIVDRTFFNFPKELVKKV